MISISICMIVRNEERLLARCLDSLSGIGDEIVIVDTGSTDRTKDIATRYTDKVYDFPWNNDFAAARNFSFSHATMDYIYTADADEVLDEVNRTRFLQLKQALLPEISVVQMKYGNQLQHGTVYNYDTEYRAKLFKRVREFRWVDPVHETVDTTTHVFDSDIVITHLPEQSHETRDFALYLHAVSGSELSPRLHGLWARELFVAGKDTDFLAAYSYFKGSLSDPHRTVHEIKAAQCVIARCSRLLGDDGTFFRMALKNMIGTPSSELCCELGDYYWEKADYQEAAIWYQTAACGAESELFIRYSGDIPLRKLALCCRELGWVEEYRKYIRQSDEWVMPSVPMAVPEPV